MTERMRSAAAALVVGVLLMAGCEPAANRDESGAVVSDGALDAFAMAVGDCFDDQSAEQILDVPGRPCGEPHDNEVFALYDVSFASYPGDEAIMESASGQCIERFPAFVGKDYESSVLDIFPITPSAESWRDGDREVICALFRVDLAKMTGSMRGSGI